MATRDDVHAMKEVYEAGKESSELETMTIKMKLKQSLHREEIKADVYRMLGRIETADIFGKLATVSSLLWLKEVKESKLYVEIPEIETWERFCNLLGKSKRLVDEKLQNLKTLGSEFLETVSNLKIGYREMRNLRKAVTDGSVVVDENHIVIGDEKIPLDDDHREDLQIALDHVINTVKKENSKLKKHVEKIITEETKSLTTERNALVKECNRLKVFDPAEKDHNWSVQQMKELQMAALEFTAVCRRFKMDERIADDMHIQGQVEGLMSEVAQNFRSLRHEWDEKFALYED